MNEDSVKIWAGRYLELEDGGLVLDKKIIIHTDNTFEYLTDELEVKAIGITRADFVDKLSSIAILNRSIYFTNKRSGYVSSISFLLEMAYL